MLLCMDFQFDARRTRADPLGMAVLEPSTGKVLHSISVQDRDALTGDTGYPQFLGDTVAWLKTHRLSNGITEYRLHRWHFRENRISTTEQTWSGFHAHANWPDKSNIVVFQYTIPQSIYQLGYFNNLYYTMAVRTLESSAHLPQFHWYESWELPTGTEAEPRFLARWALPYRGWENPHITGNGKWAIFPEPFGNDFQAAQRAKASGKGHFTGAELFDMYRSKYKEVLIYNTRTGKVQHRYSDQAAYHSVSQSMQNYFVMHSYFPGSDSKATLTELIAANFNANNYGRLFLQSDELFRIDEHGITKLQRSPALIQAQLGDRLSFAAQRLQAFQEYSCQLSELVIDGNELNTKQVWSLTNGRNTYRPVCLLPLGNQALVYSEDRQLPETLIRWLANSPKLLKWVENTWQTLQPQVQFTIVDSTDNAVREQAFVCDHRYVQDASHLYCFDRTNLESAHRTSTLHAYALPMKLHSPWWRRVAGLLPLFLLLAYCLRKNHPRRFAGG